ncbi:MAG TPA: histone deacetylase [Opitutaceae bacterium]|nr:histone deacetylase [Opitutaceae bacterium]
MIIVHDPACAAYGSFMRPEQPERILRTAPLLRERHPDWAWEMPAAASREQVLRAHDAVLLDRLSQPGDFDDDTPWFEEIDAHAARAAGAAVGAMRNALAGRPSFSLMRPPGHHATRTDAMGFCYINSVAVAALEARAAGVGRIAVWDIDGHHGNGTEDILRDREGFLYVSIHQYPGYPGTGTVSTGNARNFPVLPRIPRDELMDVFRRSWDAVVAFHPELLLVSAGFDAYAHDPLLHLTLEEPDFAALGRLVRESGLPSAGLLEGGYSRELPSLVDAFLNAWSH